MMPFPPSGQQSPRQSGQSGQPGQPGGPRRTNSAIFYLLAALIVLVFLVWSARSEQTTKVTTISYATLLHDVAANKVRSVDINQSTGVVDGVLRSGADITAQGPTSGTPGADIALFNAHGVARSYAAASSDLGGLILSWLIPLGLLALFWVWMSRRARGQMAGMQNWSRSTGKVHTTEHPTTRFTDVAGYSQVKQEVAEVVDFLRAPERFEQIGARIPKGMLLVGPPGTGKTLVARAIAGEAGVAFISITGSEFMEMFVGVGAARVRDLFKTAREQKPSIVFIDEIDAIGRKRGTGLGGGNDEREQTLNQILSEMDGFEATEGIMILAATNRPDVLDPALLRAGRFDRQIVIPLPTLEERRAILAVHARHKKLGGDVDLDTIAQATPGMSGADLENLLNEAALIAVRRGVPEISNADLESAHDRVLLGLQRPALALNGAEKHIVAVHESGHTLLAELLEHADRVHKVTILPIGMALGVTEQLPSEDRQLRQRPDLEDALAVRLGGRAAEELVFGVSSTGAQDDLTSATELAGRMVREWGMSDRVGKMSWAPRGPVFLGEELVHTRDYSDATARVIDEEVSKILDEQSRRAYAVLEAHRPALEALAAALQRAETLEGPAILEVISSAEAAAPPAEPPDDPSTARPDDPSAVPGANGTAGETAVPPAIA